MYTLFEKGNTNSFRRKHLNISFTAMALAVAVKEVFAANHEVIRGFLSKKRVLLF